MNTHTETRTYRAEVPFNEPAFEVGEVAHLRRTPIDGRNSGGAAVGAVWEVTRTPGRRSDGTVATPGTYYDAGLWRRVRQGPRVEVVEVIDDRTVTAIEIN
jgi:hypothetical protein